MFGDHWTARSFALHGERQERRLRLRHRHGHPRITVLDMACEEEQAAAVKRCRSTLHSRIKERLEKVVGSGGKDRAKMAHKDSDPADTSNCLNCLLCEKYVPMPEKRIQRKCDSSSSSSSSTLTVSSFNASSTASDTDSSTAVRVRGRPQEGAGLRTLRSEHNIGLMDRVRTPYAPSNTRCRGEWKPIVRVEACLLGNEGLVWGFAELSVGEVSSMTCATHVKYYDYVAMF